MNPGRWILAALLLSGVCAVTGCSTNANRRLVNDLKVAGVSPAQVLAGGPRDTYAVHRSNAKTIWVSPLILLHHTVKHALICLVHAADVLYYPVALCTDAGPLELYDTQAFPFSLPPETDQIVSDGMVIAYLTGALCAAWGEYAFDLVAEYGWTSHNTLIQGHAYGLVLCVATAPLVVAAQLIDEDWRERVFPTKEEREKKEEEEGD